MHVPHNATVAVADGRKLNLFQNTDTAGGITLKALPAAHPHEESGGAGNHHHDSSANPSHGQNEEDDFAAGIAALLAAQVQNGKVQHLVVIAAAKTLGEMRKQYTKSVSAVLVGELSKDLTGHSVKDIEKALQAA